MISLYTDIKLPRTFSDDSIKLGDVLTSSLTHSVVVIYNYQEKKYLVRHIDDSTITHDLKEFVEAWGHNLKVSHNINIIDNGK